MGNPTLAEPRNASDAGRTPQESADHMQTAPVDGGAKSSATLVPQKAAPQNLHPNAPGGKAYGAPIGDVVLHTRT
jgi:hypothetical protein